MRPLKMLWVDVETTGLDPVKNTIHQLAGCVVIDGIEKEEFDFKMAPAEGKEIQEEALAVSYLTVEEVTSRSTPAGMAYMQFNKILCKYVDKYNKNDKFILGAYNANFDAGFINEWYAHFDNQYFFGLCQGGAYFDPLILTLLVEMKKGKRIFKPNRKLVTVADILGVPLSNAHDALHDIRATREVAAILWRMLNE